MVGSEDLPYEPTASRASSGPPAGGARTFAQILVNTSVANVTISFLWLALTFWLYLETPPAERHANANGVVGTVQGLAFMVTSVFSGLSIGLLGMRDVQQPDRRRLHDAGPRG